MQDKVGTIADLATASAAVVLASHQIPYRISVDTRRLIEDLASTRRTAAIKESKWRRTSGPSTAAGAAA